MELMTLLKRLPNWCMGLLLLVLASNAFAATAYQYTNSGGLAPAFPTGETQPPLAPTTTGTQFTNGDTVTILSGNTMSTGANSSIAYTLGITTPTTPPTTGRALNLNVNAGATLSYGGTAPAGAAYFSTRNDTDVTTTTITIDGNISSGTGLYAIFLANLNANPAETYTININPDSNISGSILSNNVKNINVNITGTPVITTITQTIDGVINLNTSTAGTSVLTIGATGISSFTPGQSISNISLLHITNTSTMTIGVTNSNIKAVTIDAGSTLNLNETLNGVRLVADGSIINNGTMNIAANIAKTAAFIGAGTNVVTQGASAGLAITTTTYQVANHTAVLQDLYNYGNITLSTANFKLNNGGINSFNVVYGTGTTYGNGYSAGYFTTGTYTLVTATAGSIFPPTFSSAPTNTLFLTFGNPVVNGNKIQISITRTPFNVYAQNTLTKTIGSTLEIIGNTTPTSDFLNLLDAVEASTTAQATENALRQLAPLANPPYYGYEIQNETMYQVQLRLAELRNGSAYYLAGDIGRDNHIWFKPFGSYGNQGPKQDSLGYYGTSTGFAGGFDRNLDDRYTLGAGLAYSLATVKDKVNQLSSTKIKSYTGLVYGTYNYLDASHLDWVLAVTINNFDANRLVDINSIFNQVASSTYSSQQLSVMGLWGKDYEAFGFMQLTPQGMAQYTFVKQYTYSEVNGGPANLTISRTNSDVVTLGVGGIAAIPVLVDPSIVVPELHIMGYYNPVIGKQNTTFSFVAGGGPMVSIFDLSRTSLEAGIGFTIAVINHLEVKLNFNYEIADRFNGYNFFLNLRYFL